MRWRGRGKCLGWVRWEPHGTVDVIAYTQFDPCCGRMCVYAKKYRHTQPKEQGFFFVRRILSCEPHSKEAETITGEVVGWAFLVLRVNV